MVAETALSGVVRYEWRLLSPVLHALLDTVAADYARESPDEVGPPRPMPDGQPLDAARASLHSLLSSYSAPPFTLQRLCEVLLEPRKQYSRADKLLLVIERLLLVTSTLEVTSDLPPPPPLSQLGPVNENPPSPYDGEPIAERMVPPVDAQQQQQQHHHHHIGNGMGDYAVFVAVDEGSGGGMLGGDDSPGDTSPRARPPMELMDALHAEAFAAAALAGSSPEKENHVSHWPQPAMAAAAAERASPPRQLAVEGAEMDIEAPPAASIGPQTQEEVGTQLPTNTN